MSKTGVRQVANGITKRLDEMVSRERAVKGYLARNVYRQYQKAKLERWKTENRSEGGQWAALTSRYKARKLVDFASYPGAGRKLMIATDRLRQSVTGPHAEHRLLVTERSIRISTVTPYASYASDARDFTNFRPERTREWREGVMSYIVRGEMK